jgi:hypothetical protein
MQFFFSMSRLQQYSELLAAGGAFAALMKEAQVRLKPYDCSKLECLCFSFYLTSLFSSTASCWQLGEHLLKETQV